MFSLFKKPEDEVAVIFDVGNGSIGAALVSFSKIAPPSILYTCREPLTFLPVPGSRRLLDSMVKLLGQVAERLQKEGLSHLHRTVLGTLRISRVICIFSSPWYASHTKVVSIQKDKPFPVTRGFISDLIKKEERKIEDEMKSGTYQKMFGSDVSLLERKIIHTKLNGYEVENPTGKRIKEFELTFFLSFISREIAERVEHTLHKAFSFRKIEFFSYALSSWSAVSDIFPNTSSFLFADVTGEVTDVALTANGVLVETASFPLGRAAFLRTIAKELDVPPATVLSYLAMRTNGTLEKKFIKKLEPIIARVQEEWQAALQETLAGIGSRYPLPKNFFVTADNDLADLFIDVLKRPAPTDLVVANNLFDVLFLSNDVLKPFTHTAGAATADPFLSLESIFCNKILS